MPPIRRRALLVGGTVAGIAAACGDSEDSPKTAVTPLPRRGDEPKAGEPPKQAEKPPIASPLPTRTFGKTGEQITLLGLGGIWNGTEVRPREEGIAVIQRAYELGIRYFDTATAYGESEDRTGEALDGKRADCFITTKSPHRLRDAALADLEQSLSRLRTDHVDCWLIHDNRKDSDVRTILGKGGALEAFIQAKEQKMARYIGVSGHADPAILEALLGAHPFDVTLLALNAADAYAKPFIPTVLQKAVQQNLGIIGMKVYGYANLLKAISATDAMSYALSLPVAGVVIGMKSIEEVETNVAIARSLKTLSPSEMTMIEERAISAAHDATFFRHDPYWTT